MGRSRATQEPPFVRSRHVASLAITSVFIVSCGARSGLELDPDLLPDEPAARDGTLEARGDGPVPVGDGASERVVPQDAGRTESSVLHDATIDTIVDRPERDVRVTDASRCDAADVCMTP